MHTERQQPLIVDQESRVARGGWETLKADEEHVEGYQHAAFEGLPS